MKAYTVVEQDMILCIPDSRWGRGRGEWIRKEYPLARSYFQWMGGLHNCIGWGFLV